MNVDVHVDADPFARLAQARRLFPFDPGERSDRVATRCVVSIVERARMHAHPTGAQRFSVGVLAAGQKNVATLIGHIVAIAARDRLPRLHHASRFATLVPLREETPDVPEFR